MTQVSSDVVFVWRAADVARKTDLCYLCDKVYRAGEQIAIFGVPGPRGWSKGHIRCAMSDPRMIEKPNYTAPPVAEKKAPGSARMIVDERPGKYSNKYLVFIGEDHLYTETSKDRAEGAVNALNALFAKQSKPT